jgi:hypothetical protein
LFANSQQPDEPARVQDNAPQLAFSLHKEACPIRHFDRAAMHAKGGSWTLRAIEQWEQGCF